MSTNTLKDIIIMEDLCEKQYKISQSKNGLDMAHMKVVLVKLAKFHAASAVSYERYGEFDEKFNRGLYNEDMHEIFDRYYDGSFAFLISKIFSSWGLDKKIIDKMVRFANHFSIMKSQLNYFVFFAIESLEGTHCRRVNSVNDTSREWL